MATKPGFRFGRTILINAAACAAALVAISLYAQAVSAEQWSISPRPMHARAELRSADLERAFWLCDYTATTRGVHAAPIAECSAVTDELKHEKFGGDFEQMLAWWRQNKPLEHAKLASGAW